MEVIGTVGSGIFDQKIVDDQSKRDVVGDVPE